MSSSTASGRRWWAMLAAGCFFVTLLSAGQAESAPSRPVYTIAVGHNAVADVLRRDAAGLVTLRYADDDALRFFALLQNASRYAFLLTVADADTQRRFPEVTRRALAPTLAELDRVVELVARAVVQDRAAGDEPEVVFFFSGHGVRDESGNASLSLLDGALTRTWLYERFLARIPARFIHLVIDACHAEALVRPRDVDAKIEPLEAPERQRYLDQTTLERFPNVGAVLASSAGAQSFEWDAYRSGVFAHQLLSALRGASDVNGDGLVEYSEVAAFLSAANLRVKDPRARLEIVVQAPRVNRRTPLLDLGTLSHQFELRGRADGVWANGFFVESESGERLLDVFPERSARLALRLPIGERLYLIRPDGEIDLGVREGMAVELASLRSAQQRTRARGAIDSALHEGLFKVRYGPAFYQGYVGQYDDIVGVELAPEKEIPTRDSAPSKPSSTRDTAAIALVVAGGVAAVAAGVFTGLALDAKGDYEGTDFERTADEARHRFERNRTAAWVSAGAAVALGGTGVVLMVLPSGDSRPSAARLDGFGIGARGKF
ncbi:MAG TPA: caspase family protein [Polyangiaceae bacterium]